MAALYWIVRSVLRGSLGLDGPAKTSVAGRIKQRTVESAGSIGILQHSGSRCRTDRNVAILHVAEH